ncbi:hypothetical protein AOQ84DRAFT_430107 [Glonium stellatum]|uniref:PLC-like phosphodiesterase n=1 Tax=Glonium stellatum TaxID=574774 RepID=A0A8E2F8R2_9PEZI|nr:hypothetical protein AOQ84DRAFT_430107 [Glonium stellatum]
MISQVVLCLFVAATAGQVGVTAQRICNNSPNLCNRTYDSITYLGAHDSPFVRDVSTGYSSFGDQFFNTSTQLDAGVRMLTAQVHAVTTAQGAQEWHLCHTLCNLFDVGKLSDWLWEVRTWLDRNPTDVVTIILVNSDNAKAADLMPEFSAADIAHYAYVPPFQKPPPVPADGASAWPALNEMIDQGKRLVSFVASIDPASNTAAPYLLNEFDFVWETAYDVSNASGFKCTPDRPPSLDASMAAAKAAGMLFMMNHFLYWDQAFGIQVPDIRNVQNTNAWDGEGSLGQTLLDCSGQYQRQPTFVLVDFFNVGPAIDSVDIFNGVKDAVGRTLVTAEVVGGGAGIMEEERSITTTKTLKPCKVWL